MVKPNWQAARLQAFAVLRDLERPPEVTKVQWRSMMDLLYVVAKAQPRCYLGQQTLAQRSGLSVRSVQRYTALAQQLGVLEVWYDAGTKSRRSPAKTSVYHIISVSQTAANLAGVTAANLAGKGYSDTDVSAVPEKEPSVPEQALGPKVRAGRAGTTTRVRKIPPMEKPVLTASEAIAAANAIPRIKRRPRAKDPDPARRLTGYFIEKWEDVLVLAPFMASVRGIESRGEMTGYIRQTFLSPAEGKRYTEAEVRWFIDEFAQAVVQRTVLVKTGQSAWRRFTGWWGRRPAEPEPGGARRYFEEQQQNRLTKPPDPA